MCINRITVAALDRAGHSGVYNRESFAVKSFTKLEVFEEAKTICRVVWVVSCTSPYGLAAWTGTDVADCLLAVYFKIRNLVSLFRMIIRKANRVLPAVHGLLAAAFDYASSRKS